MVDTIPGPLLDRMEVIRLAGYIGSEKKAIARHYLEPNALAESGVPRGAVTLTDAALNRLIDVGWVGVGCVCPLECGRVLVVGHLSGAGFQESSVVLFGCFDDFAWGK